MTPTFVILAAGLGTRIVDQSVGKVLTAPAGSRLVEHVAAPLGA